MLTLLASTVLAAEGPGPLLAPTATPMDAHRAEIGVTGAAVLMQLDTYCLEADATGATRGCGPSTAIYGGGAIEARAVPVDRLQLHAGVAYFPEGGLLGGQADIAYSAVNTPHVHLAPWLAVIGNTDGSVASAGLSFDAGGKRVTFDLSTPLVAVGLSEAGMETVEPGIPLLATEAGVTFHFSETQSLRVGMESVMPGIAYRGSFGPVFVEARLHALPIAVAGSLETGVHF